MRLSTRSRTLTVTAAVIAVALVAGATALVAAPQGKPMMQGTRLMQGPGPAGPGGPDGAPGPHLERVLQRLDLSDDQWVAVQAVLDANRADAMAQAESMQAAREVLRQAIHAEPLDEAAIRAAAADVATLEADGAVQRAQTLQAIRAELTDEQRAELNDILAEGPQRRMHRHRP